MRFLFITKVFELPLCLSILNPSYPTACQNVLSNCHGSHTGSRFAQAECYYYQVTYCNY